MKGFLMLLGVGVIALSGCADGKTSLEDEEQTITVGRPGGSAITSQKQEQVPSNKTTELSCNLRPAFSSNFPPKSDLSDMSRAIQKCKHKASDAQVVYDPGWSCNVWSISGSDANKMKQCLIENFGWKELGPPGWIENTIAAPPF